MCTTKQSVSHWFLFFCLVIAIFAGGIDGASSYDDNREVYIVHMGSLPEGEYSPSSHHLSILQSVMTDESMAPNHLVRSYTKSFNGFAARLTKEEQETIASMEEVVSVFPNGNFKLKTTRSWSFTGLTESAKRATNVESDLIIGVIDTGITIESESFSDKGFGPPPKKWKGVCDGGKHFKCNNKVIGARYYVTSDAIDREGHGTHCASTAAGNVVKGVSFFGLASGNARGGVPSARIAVYKVCVANGSCPFDAILAGFDDAVDDGVDIISASVGPNAPLPFFTDPVGLGSFYAMKKGIFTSVAAGNEGPDRGTVSAGAPWLTSVAASTTDRRIIDKVVLGDGTTIIGKSVNPVNLNGTMYPLVYGRNASRSCNASMAKSCAPNCFEKDVVYKGKIVICSQLSEKDLRVINSGNALGIILLQKTLTDPIARFPFPATLVNEQDGKKLEAYMKSAKMPQAIIEKSEGVKDFTAPNVGDFSSRGPNSIEMNILKPDIIAPGVSILAAFSPFGNPFDVSYKNDKVPITYAFESGTSMSCPHVSGAAAYVKSFHPHWSPAVIRSALMTTAWPLNVAKNPDGELGYGAGHMDPIRALNPGLVYDAQFGDYILMLCNIGFGSRKMGLLSKGKYKCPTKGRNGTARDLNYPSMAYHNHKNRPFKVQFTRTVTNVGLRNSAYKAIVSSDPIRKVTVTPQVLSFKSLGEKQSFVVTISGNESYVDSLVSASLVWSDGIHSVRSPIVVY